MASRHQLQSEFEELLGSKNVYYDPPASVSMNYPAIRYVLSDIQPTYANNSVYTKRNSYDVTLIDYDPDSNFVDAILKLPYCRFNRTYVSDNLTHFVFKLYH